MKNKHNAVISVLICLVLIASIFTACSKKGDEASSTTLKPNETWIEGIKVTYPNVQITGVELAEIVAGALGDEFSDFNDDSLGTLTPEQLDQVIDYAEQNGYIVETDANGNIIIKKPDIPTTELSSEEYNDLYEQASVSDPANLTPEEEERLSEVIQENDYEVVTNEAGSTQVVRPNPTREAVTYTVVHTRPAQQGGTNAVENIQRETLPPPTQATSPMGSTVAQAKLALPGWLETYGDAYHHNFVSNAVTDDGGVVTVGVSYSPAEDGSGAGYGAVIAKFDDEGNLDWDKKLQGNNQISFEDVAVLTDGSIIVVGYTSATDVADDATYVCKGTLEGIIIKYSKDGSRQWIKMIGGSGDEMIYSVAATPDGGFVLGGKANSIDGTLANVGTQKIKAFTTKCTKDGAFQWHAVLSGTKHSSVESISVAPNGTIYTAINCVTGDGEYAAIEGTKTGLTTTVVSKIKTDGTIEWSRCLHGSGKTEMFGLAASNNGVAVAGHYSSTSAGNIGTFSDLRNGGNAGTVDGVVLSLDASGNQKWITPLVGFQNDFISDIVAIPGGYAVSGYSNSSNRDFAFLSGSNDFDSFIYTFSNYGDIRTHSSYGGTANDNARAICASGKTLYISGMTNSADGVFADCSIKGSDDKGAGVVYQFKLEY